MGKKRNPKKPGAKGKYRKWITEEGLALIADWSRNGKTNDEIAKSMKITRSTLYEWLNKYTVISDAIKNNREVSDAKVENAFFKSAVGYHYIEEQPIKVKRVYHDEFNRRVEEEKVELVQVQKYQPPIPTNQIFYLKNRRVSGWKDKQQVELETTTPLSIIIETLKGKEF